MTPPEFVLAECADVDEIQSGDELVRWESDVTDAEGF